MQVHSSRVLIRPWENIRTHSEGKAIDWHPGHANATKLLHKTCTLCYAPKGFSYTGRSVCILQNGMPWHFWDHRDSPETPTVIMKGRRLPAGSVLLGRRQVLPGACPLSWRPRPRASVCRRLSPPPPASVLRPRAPAHTVPVWPTLCLQYFLHVNLEMYILKCKFWPFIDPKPNLPLHLLWKFVSPNALFLESWALTPDPQALSRVVAEMALWVPVWHDRLWQSESKVCTRHSWRGYVKIMGPTLP